MSLACLFDFDQFSWRYSGRRREYSMSLVARYDREWMNERVNGCEAFVHSRDRFGAFMRQFMRALNNILTRNGFATIEFLWAHTDGLLLVAALFLNRWFAFCLPLNSKSKIHCFDMTHNSEKKLAFDDLVSLFSARAFHWCNWGLFCVFKKLEAAYERLRRCRVWLFRTVGFEERLRRIVKSIIERFLQGICCLGNCVMKCLISIRMRSWAIWKASAINHAAEGWLSQWVLAFND